MPIFAANLRLLQPMRAAAAADAGSSDSKQESNDQQQAAPPAVPDHPGPETVMLAAAAPVQTTHEPGNTSNVKPSHASHVLDLDFLAQQQQQQSSHTSTSHSTSSLSSSCTNHITISQLEQELLSDPQVPDTGPRQTDGEKLLQTLLTSSSSILCPPPAALPPPLPAANGFKAMTIRNGAAVASAASVPLECKGARHGLSAEACEILDELPILSFLRSNLT